jgi:hypothetical protein
LFNGAFSQLHTYISMRDVDRIGCIIRHFFEGTEWNTTV